MDLRHLNFTLLEAGFFVFCFFLMSALIYLLLLEHLVTHGTFYLLLVNKCY